MADSTKKPGGSETEKVIRYVQGMVADGRLLPGDRLPAERKISETLKVTRAQVRLALERLAFYGVIQTFPQSGSVLADHAPSVIVNQIGNMLEVESFDFVIGSVHMASRRYGHKDLYYLPRADVEYYQGVISDYLDDVLSLSRWGKFHVLGHLTLPLRYIRKNAGITMDFSAHMDAVEEIFRCIIPAGIGIECNTNRGDIPLPDADILKLYRRLGGEIITIGTDAHSTEYVGCRAAETQQLLRDCGFRYFTTYDRGVPAFRPL